MNRVCFIITEAIYMFLKDKGGLSTVVRIVNKSYSEVSDLSISSKNG